jgi:DNA-binding NarL/FixJ family response regulator
MKNSNQTHWSPDMDGSGFAVRRHQELRLHSGQLSSREMEVLQLVAEGKANKETAWELGISVKTVEKHRQHLMENLDIHDTAGLTRYAIGAGVIDGRVQLAIV